MGYCGWTCNCKFAGCKLTDLKTKQEMIYNRNELTNNWFIVQNRTNDKVNFNIILLNQ